MEPGYDFTDGVPNPYAATFVEGGSVVVLEPDVAVAHLDSEAVGQALRKVMREKCRPGAFNGRLAA
jgi:hypothetical protein